MHFIWCYNTSMAIDPIKIPQNVYVEDRIVGPLTLRQVLITAVGCGFSYALYGSLQRAYGVVSIPITVLAWVPGFLSVIFAFIRINDLSFLHLLLLVLEKTSKSPVRSWTPRRGISINIRTFTRPVKETHHESKTMEEEQQQNRHISEISTLLDHPLPPHRTMPDIQPSQEPIPAAPDATDADSASLPPIPVDPSRITVGPLNVSTSMDTVTPTTGTVSIFHDLSPRPQ